MQMAIYSAPRWWCNGGASAPRLWFGYCWHVLFTFLFNFRPLLYTTLPCCNSPFTVHLQRWFSCYLLHSRSISWSFMCKMAPNTSHSANLLICWVSSPKALPCASSTKKRCPYPKAQGGRDHFLRYVRYRQRSPERQYFCKVFRP